eukprot:scaffold47414_cov29-Tisochrysis_lutea.AAC.1
MARPQARTPSQPSRCSYLGEVSDPLGPRCLGCYRRSAKFDVHDTRLSQPVREVFEDDKRTATDGAVSVERGTKGLEGGRALQLVVEPVLAGEIAQSDGFGDPSRLGHQHQTRGAGRRGVRGSRSAGSAAEGRRRGWRRARPRAERAPRCSGGGGGATASGAARPGRPELPRTRRRACVLRTECESGRGPHALPVAPAR